MKPLLELFDIIIAYFHTSVKSANGFIFQNKKAARKTTQPFISFNQCQGISSRLPERLLH